MKTDRNTNVRFVTTEPDKVTILKESTMRMKALTVLTAAIILSGCAGGKGNDITPMPVDSFLHRLAVCKGDEPAFNY